MLGPRFVARTFARWARWSWPPRVLLKGRSVGVTTLEGAMAALEALSGAAIPEPWDPVVGEGEAGR